MTAGEVLIKVGPRSWRCSCKHRLAGLKNTAAAIESADAHAAFHSSRAPYPVVTVELGAVASAPVDAGVGGTTGDGPGLGWNVEPPIDVPAQTSPTGRTE